MEVFCKQMRFSKTIVFVSLCLSLIQLDLYGKPLILADLRCQYRVNPIGVDSAEPRLSWKLQSHQRDKKQIAYRIIAASSEKRLMDNSADLWDSGKVLSDKTIQIKYKEKTLRSSLEVYWKVKWIAAEDNFFKTNDFPGGMLLRKEVTIHEGLKNATIYICGLGHHECPRAGGDKNVEL